MEDFGLIRNTDIEELMLRYRQNQLVRSNWRGDDLKDTITRQVMESFEFLCKMGKPLYATLSPEELKVAQNEIKKRSAIELNKIKRIIRATPFFIRFIVELLYSKKIYEYQFKIDHGHSQALSNSSSFETLRNYAKIHHINGLGLPVNFEELVEQVFFRTKSEPQK